MFESPAISNKSSHSSPLRLVGLMLFVAGVLLLTGAVVWSRMGPHESSGSSGRKPPPNPGFITMLVIGLISCVFSCVFVCASARRPSEVLRPEPASVPYMHVATDSPRVSV
jgi:drug/metabolite transporter (DMT)-like permease